MDLSTLIEDVTAFTGCQPAMVEFSYLVIEGERTWVCKVRSSRKPNGKIDKRGGTGYGATPEEAVAHLKAELDPHQKKRLALEARIQLIREMGAEIDPEKVEAMVQRVKAERS